MNKLPRFLDEGIETVSKITLLFGSGNPAKLRTMRKSVEGLDIELVGLGDMAKSAPDVAESGSDPLENARIKALTYFRHYGIPTVSHDCGLFFENPDFPDELQPGVNVRRVNGKTLTDDEMTEYYSGLAKKYGKLTAQYKNALCLVLSEDVILESMDKSLWSEPFCIVDTPHSGRRHEGYPLDCISVSAKTGRYYYDAPKESFGGEFDGRRAFFEKYLSVIKESCYERSV